MRLWFLEFGSSCFFVILTHVTHIIFVCSSRRRHTRYWRDGSSDVCSSDLRRRSRRRPRPGGATAPPTPEPGARRRRSEERRVGKECRSRWSPYHSKKNRRRRVMHARVRRHTARECQERDRLARRRWRSVARAGVFFFLQAEDGIRDIGVTGVQTCALPISAANDPSTPVMPAGSSDLRRTVTA